jgi:hypothetical protein
MAVEAPVNGVSSTLASPYITSTSQTTCAITNAAAAGFTNAQYHALLANGPLATATVFEMVLVTGVTSGVATIQRAVESFAGVETAATFGAGSTITVVNSVASIIALITQAVISGTQIQNVVANLAWAAEPTYTLNAANVFSLTGGNTAITSMTANCTVGTPQHGQDFRFEFTDDGTSQAITWGSLFTSPNPEVAWPTATNAGKITRAQGTWNVVTSTIDCIGDV